MTRWSPNPILRCHDYNTPVHVYTCLRSTQTQMNFSQVRLLLLLNMFVETDRAYTKEIKFWFTILIHTRDLISICGEFSCSNDSSGCLVVKTFTAAARAPNGEIRLAYLTTASSRQFELQLLVGSLRLVKTELKPLQSMQRVAIMQPLVDNTAGYYILQPPLSAMKVMHHSWLVWQSCSFSKFW